MTGRPTATSFTTVFTCGGCGLEKVAKVTLPPGMSANSAREALRDGDAPSVPANVSAVLARTECPRCGRVDTPFRPLRAAKLVTLALLLALVGFLKACVDDSTVWLAGGVVGVVLVGVLFWRGLTAATILRGTTVELSDESLPVRQLVGATCPECSKRIVTADAGAWCPECAAPVHRRTCAQRHAVGAHGGAASGKPYRGSASQDVG
jgi:hypothetical protein